MPRQVARRMPTEREININLLKGYLRTKEPIRRKQEQN
jgi:hypothetical protein